MLLGHIVSTELDAPLGFEKEIRAPTDVVWDGNRELVSPAVSRDVGHGNLDSRPDQAPVADQGVLFDERLQGFRWVFVQARSEDFGQPSAVLTAEFVPLHASHLLQVLPALFELHVLRATVVVPFEHIPADVHPVADDLGVYVVGEVVGDAPAPDGVGIH